MLKGKILRRVESVFSILAVFIDRGTAKGGGSEWVGEAILSKSACALLRANNEYKDE